MSPAVPSVLQDCTGLSGFGYANTEITKAELEPGGTLSYRNEPIGEHCLVTGQMNQRTSPVDGQTYAIGFEMRMPTQWNGRFLYQGNGGIDGSVATALGTAGQTESALQEGFAVISSDAGHSAAQNPTFGLDPQARLDFGYQAVGTLTPMAKALITAAYKRGPDRSYMIGASNGGRHTMVGAARYADQYDGFLAVSPGFNLPRAAIAQEWGAQQWATVASTPGDLTTALTPAETVLLGSSILDRCDKRDGLVDGMVQAIEQCQNVFSVKSDVPTCAGERDGTCLTLAQKAVVSRVFAGARTSDGTPIYSSFPFDPGVSQSGWSAWKFFISVFLDPGGLGYVFTTPPDAPPLNELKDYALTVDIDRVARSVTQTAGIYTESAMQFMTPPNPTRLDTLRDRGAKLLVIHGGADGVFSPNDTAAWFGQLEKNYKNKADRFARYFEVPGMGHVSGGPSTDRFDAITALVNWVEKGTAPDRLLATVSPGNRELPTDWSADRSRPLCVYPEVATYRRGDPESADSFVCSPGPAHK